MSPPNPDIDYFVITTARCVRTAARLVAALKSQFTAEFLIADLWAQGNIPATSTAVVLTHLQGGDPPEGLESSLRRPDGIGWGHRQRELVIWNSWAGDVRPSDVHEITFAFDRLRDEVEAAATDPDALGATMAARFLDAVQTPCPASRQHRSVPMARRMLDRRDHIAVATYLLHGFEQTERDRATLAA